MLAGMIAPTEATWVALMVLYTACLRYGAPVHLVSDSGGAYTSADFEAVCMRLQIQHETIISTQGESYQNLALYQQLSHEPQSSCNALLNKELWRHYAGV